MELEKLIRGRLAGRYDSLFFELRCLDRGWHSFEVIWSDDGGATKISMEFELSKFDKQLLGASANTIASAIVECRQEETTDD